MPPDQPTLKTRLAHALFGDVIQAAVTAAVSARVADDPGWHPLTPAGPHDRDYADWLQDQTDALEAWRKNFMVRRVVTLTRSYVLGGGITLGSKHPWVNKFILDFSRHPENQLDRRLGPMCDELTRAGELFPVLFTNRVDGMSYLRFVPATQITHIETDPDDYETELTYIELSDTGLEGRTWLSPAHTDSWKLTADGSLPPVMLHCAVNRPIGATRGEGDLGPILRWALRYSNWLEDRVRLNRVRTRQQLLEIELADDTKVKQRKRQVETEDPIKAGIYVHGPGEKVVAHKLEIGAGDAKEDGRALRLAIATGSNIALHYMGEGEAVNYATAREMGEPTARFYTERQADFCAILLEICKVAYQRKAALGLARLPAGGSSSENSNAPLGGCANYQLIASVTETARADNQGLAQAALMIVQALGEMKAQGWIDDPTAVGLAFKFAGETIGQDEIERLLEEAEPTRPEAREVRSPDRRSTDRRSARNGNLSPDDAIADAIAQALDELDGERDHQLWIP